MNPIPANRSNTLDEFDCSDIAYFGRSSFEKRCFSAFSALKNCNFRHQIFLKSAEETNEAKSLRKNFEISSELTKSVETNDPLQTQRVITEIVSELAELDDQISVLLDITCFRREELLILVRSVVNYFNRTRLEKTYFVYSVASSMGTWLSNSVREVRPVIGYPGDVSITKKTHLILLAGVEYHRALAVIQAYEPYSISLGTVPEDQAVNSEIFKRNEELRVWLKRNFEQVLQTFHFPATDPMALKCQLRKFISEFSDYNVVIAPLNTKLSTLAAGALAVSKPEIQLCYAEVNVYNAGDYSTPSNDIVLVPAKKLLTDD